MSRFEPNATPHLPPDEAAPEDLHLAASIQSYGVLWAFSQPELTLIQVSANTQDYLGVLPSALLGQSLHRLLDADSIASLQHCLLESDRHNYFSLRLGTSQSFFGSTTVFDGTLYFAAETLLLELEPVATLTSLPVQPSLTQAIAQLRCISDLTEFLQQSATAIRRLTKFDRVLVYQFDAQGAGAVVAESKSDNLSSYLGLHYPATDIPEPVRASYQQGLVRYIPDLTAPSIDLIPPENPLTQQPLDLQHSVLRSVDPCCITYHNNMGVDALFVIALVQGDFLWGLISCHNQQPKAIAPSIRQECQVLGQLIASELSNKVNIEELNYLTRLRSLQSEFVQAIAQQADLKQALIHPAPRLLDLVSAQGAAICLDDEITLVGTTPSLAQVRDLIQWCDQSPLLTEQSDYPGLFYTHALSRHCASAEAFESTASGLLLLEISKVRHYSILWFRPEVLQTINWAGDPSSSIIVAADGSMTLCPRQSFEKWQEIVRSTALPWKACELENAVDLRRAIAGIVLKKADELAQINQALERSNQELDSFAYAASHDLKEPLRGIHNYSNLLLRSYADILDETGKARLQTLLRLTRRMETLIDALLKFSRLGQVELTMTPTDLNPLLQQILEEFTISRPDAPLDFHLPRPLPMVNCDPILIAEVLVNLISNAIKYNDKPEPWVEVGYLESPAGKPAHYIFYVRDNGIGIRDRHIDSVFRLFKRLHEQHLYGGGTGAGLTIAKKIIERHGGRIWVESTYGEGSTFYFSLI